SYLYSYGARPLDSDKLEDPYRRGPAAAKVAVDEVEQSLRVILPWLAQAHR
ncbi:MAG: phosphotyrosine protein phosphatase, partial [Rothia mucilaginosa]|nr:phosphotyrosine protein phosphatase [Rothia mucilaginosa]